MKNVMTRAWEIATDGAAKFGGSKKQYFQQALVIAWAEEKQPVKRTVAEVAKMIDSKVGYGVKVNLWERYGKKRIYVNKGFKQTVFMLEFDQQDNYIGQKELGLMDMFGASQAGIREELEAIFEVIKEIA